MNLIPALSRTLAVSGTRNTLQPRFSKNVHSRDMPIVLPPHEPPVKTNLWQILLSDSGLTAQLIYKRKQTINEIIKIVKRAEEYR